MVTIMPTEFVINYTGQILNFTRGDTEDEQLEDSFWNTATLIKTAPVLLVLIATIIGNLALILLLTLKASRRRKRVNIFIVNLAVADLTVAFITMTTELLEAVFKQWILGAFLCKFSRYCQGMTLSSTTFMLTVMSIDRYQVIVRPLWSVANRPNIKAKVITAWTLACIFAIPQTLIFVQVKEHNDELNTYIYNCESAGYSHMWQRKLYFTAQTFHVLVLPAGIMLYCYSSIVAAIWNRGDGSTRTPSILCKRRSSSPRVSMRRSVISSSRRRVVFMTLSVIIAYIACLTPYFIVNLIRIYSHYTVQLSDLEATSRIIFMLHSALNPLLYGLFTIRKRQLCCVRPASNKQRQSFSTDNSLETERFMHLKEPRRSVTRRMVNCLSNRNAQETDVILKNHIAKEETIIKLKNRESSKFLTGIRRTNETNTCSGRWSAKNGYTSNRCSSFSKEAPVNIHTSVVVDNISSASNV